MEQKARLLIRNAVAPCAPVRRSLALLVVLLGILGLGMAGPAEAASRLRPWSGTLSDVYALYTRGKYIEAAQMVIPRAEAGDAQAQGLLGYFYEYGQGVPQNFEAAAFYYSCAAEQGDPTAQYMLGLLYDKGRGVPMDVVLAQKWLILATGRADRPQRDVYARIRDGVATKMTKLQIRLAQDLASQWMPAPSVPLR